MSLILSFGPWSGLEVGVGVEYKVFMSFSTLSIKVP